jgi:hypothetical protein
MSSSAGECDSTELAYLRAKYRRLHCKSPCTPLRLGAFACIEGAVVTDFGAHSARWIRLFNEGVTLKAGLFKD